MRKLSPFLRNSLSVFAIGISSLWPTGDTEARENSRHQLCRGEQAPESMIKRYLWAMENHSASAIQELFTTDGTVISTSVGNANAAIFYEKFLPQIKSAKTQLGEIYKSTTDDHHYS